MSSTDGYSSDEEETQVPQKSTVFLGFVDAEIEDEQPTIEDTFIGGQPVWLNPQSPPQDDLLSCKNCGEAMALVLQAFSPLEGTFYDRVIYVFSCQKTRCNRTPGSVRAIRGVLKDPKKIADLKKQEDDELKQQLDEKLKFDNPKNFLFDDKKETDGSSNPFGSSTTANPFASSSQPNPFTSSTTTTASPFSANPFEMKDSESAKPSFSSIVARAAPPPKPLPKKTIGKQLPEYPGYFTYVDQESFNKKPQSKKMPDNVKISDSALDMEEGPSGKEKELNPEAQAVSAGLQDQVFQSFSEIVEYNPAQVLRYDIGGKPLLFSGKDDVAPKIVKNLVPKPSYNPSSQRQFELQVMPKTILDFEKGEVSIEGGIEWGTIIVYTDEEDYMPQLDDNHVGYVEEWVGVQWEEPIKRK